MGTYDRRTFLRQSAMLGAAVAAGRFFPSSATEIRAQAGSDHPFFARAKGGPRPEVIAHRGGDRELPGETMLAMRGAVKAGADVLEMDVYRALDGTKKNGELVLMHDRNVKNTTDAECDDKKDCSVNSFTVEKLQKLNAGFKWSNDGGKSRPFDGTKEFPPGVTRNDLRVPTLEEVFKAFPRETRMVIEMKSAPAESSPVDRLCELIREHRKEEYVLVASFSKTFMLDFRRKLPEVATSVTLPISLENLKPSIVNVKKALGSLLKVFADLEAESAAGVPSKPVAIQLPHWLVIDPVVKRAKQRRLVVHAWTVNDDRDMEKMLKNQDVGGIITDRPTRLLALRAGHAGDLVGGLHPPNHL